MSALATEGGWLETPLDGDVAEALRVVPGIARVETYRVLPGEEYQGVRITAVAVSPGGRTLMSWDSGKPFLFNFLGMKQEVPGTLSFWDLATRRWIGDRVDPGRTAFDPTGKTWAVIDGRAVKVYEWPARP